MKQCCRCHNILPLDQFKRAKNRPDGLNPECKPCCKERYQANRDKNLAYRKTYYATHREEEKARTRARSRTDAGRKRTAEYIAARRGDLPPDARPALVNQRVWRVQYSAVNRQELNRKAKEWQRANRARATTTSALWRAAHPENVIARRHKRRATVAANGGHFTAREWRALKTQYAFTCLCCGQSEPAIKLTPDHVVPLAVGGSNDIGNIQPLCFSCNSKKSTKTTDYRTAR